MLIWLAEKLKEMAEAEMTDDSEVRSELMKLQVSFELGEITDEEYLKRERELLDRLEEIRKYREDADR